MFAPGKELMATMEIMIEKEIKRLLTQADSCVFVMYDPNNPVMDPTDYICHEREGMRPLRMDVSLDFEGIGVWYMVFRNGETFSAKKILLHIEAGHFKHGQMGNFEGYWEDFPQYILEDRWVQAQLAKTIGNDAGEAAIAEANTDLASDQHYQTFASDIDHMVHPEEEDEDYDYYEEAAEISDEGDHEGEAHWYEPPEEKEPELSPFVLDDMESRDLNALYDDDEVAVDAFPLKPFSRFATS